MTQVPEAFAVYPTEEIRMEKFWVKERVRTVVFNPLSLEFLLEVWDKGIGLDLQPITFVQSKGFSSNVSSVHIEFRMRFYSEAKKILKTLESGDEECGLRLQASAVPLSNCMNVGEGTEACFHIL